MPTKQARQQAAVGMLEQCLYQNQCDARLSSVVRRRVAAAHQLGHHGIPVVPWLAAAPRGARSALVGARC